MSYDPIVVSTLSNRLLQYVKVEEHDLKHTDKKLALNYCVPSLRVETSQCIPASNVAPNMSSCSGTEPSLVISDCSLKITVDAKHMLSWIKPTEANLSVARSHDSSVVDVGHVQSWNLGGHGKLDPWMNIKHMLSWNDGKKLWVVSSDNPQSDVVDVNCSPCFVMESRRS